GEAGTGPGGTAGVSVGSGGIAGRPDGGGGSGGRGIDAGFDARTDAGSIHRIHCGTLTCFAPEQFCCIPDGASARCVAAGGTCPAAGNKLLCDDGTDCLGNNLICCVADVPNGSSLADCRSLATCNGPKAQVL